MKSLFFGMMLLASFSFQSMAQTPTKQYLSKVNYQKTEQDATVFEIAYPANQVEDGLKALAQTKGVKVVEKNGFFEARNLTLPKLNSSYDVYYKVVKDGKKECKVYMILAQPGEDLMNRTSSHGELAGSAAGGAVILSTIAPHLDEQDYNMVKLEQEAEIKQAEKKVANLQDEQSKLQKRQADINKEIEKNASDQQKAASELEAKKSALAQLQESRGAGVKKN